MENIKLKTEFIKLDQLLKFGGLTGRGGEAKMLIADGFVRLNGEVCTMRGKKIYPGDEVTVEAPEHGISASWRIS